MTATNLAGEGYRSNDNHHVDHSGNYSTFAWDSNASTKKPSNMYSSQHPRRRVTLGGAVLVVLSTVLLPLATAQTASAGKCISLASSRACLAFNESSISTSSALTAE